MKDRPVVQWRMSSSVSWVGLFLGVAVIVGAVVVAEGSIFPGLYVILIAGAVSAVALARLISLKRRPLRLAHFKQSSSITNATITGVRTSRRVDVDFSPFSLLDGSSGLSFPKIVSFEARDDNGRLIVSRPTNVPSALAEQYIGLPVSVYTSPVTNERYVDIEGLPHFNPMDAITRVMEGK